MERLADEIEDISGVVSNQNLNTTLEKLQSFSVSLDKELDTDETLSKFQRDSLLEVRSCIAHLRENITQSPSSSPSNGDKEGGDEKQEGRQKSIGQTIIKGDVKFSSIAGLDVVKSLLHEAVILPVQYPHLFTGKVKPWKSILLYGPPGTGKSTIAHAVSTEANCTFFSLSSSDLLSSWFGESEKLIKELFSQARKMDRAIIFIDEIDSICRKRSSKEEETTRRVKNELLKQMDGFAKSTTKKLTTNLFVLCATNCPWELDTAFLRRFSKRIYIPLPGDASRKELFKINLKDVKIDLSDRDLDCLIEQTEGYSGSDISNCISEAVLQPIRELRDCAVWKWNDDKMSSLSPTFDGDTNAIPLRLENIPSEKVQPRKVTIQDLLQSVQLNKRTVSSEETLRFKTFTEEFGQNG